MSILDITRESVLDAIARGHHTLADLADHFAVVPTSHTLHQQVADLLAEQPAVLREDHGHLHTIGHDLLEDMEEQP